MIEIIAGILVGTGIAIMFPTYAFAIGLVSIFLGLALLGIGAVLGSKE